jgi:hypothetical protein
LNDLLGVRLDRGIKADDYFSEGDIKHQSGSVPTPANLKKRWGFKTRFHDLTEILKSKPSLVELHFSEEDIDYPFEAPSQPYPQPANTFQGRSFRIGNCLIFVLPMMNGVKNPAS